MFSAHIRKNGQSSVSQSVQEHCQNTAKLCAEYASAFHMSKISRLIGIFHDSGKLCRDFDDYIHGRNDYVRGSIDHCYAGAKYLTMFAAKTGNKKAIETADMLARIIMSHHGVHDWIGEDGEDYFKIRVSKEERYPEIEKNIELMISDSYLSDLLVAAIQEYGIVRKKIIDLAGDDSQRKKCAFYFGMLERLLESVLVDADRTDTADFQWNTKTEKNFSRSLWTQFDETIEAYCAGFAEKTDYISTLRNDISDRCRKFSERKVNICRMIVPTGGGKTISSLRFAVNYCKRNGLDRIIYVAPYMSILEQNSAVIKEILGEEYVLEHHSNIVSGINDEDELSEYELRSDKWDMPIVATTMVQFLNTFFSYRMDSVRRMHRLANAVIIIDEVQSVPVKCIYLFNLAMNFISYIGNSCVVLCSATQPTFDKTDYKLELDSDSSMTGAYEADFQNLKRNDIVLVDDLKGKTFDEAAEFCKKKLDKNGKILFVVNTKKAAIELYNRMLASVDEQTSVYHLSTNMCPERRKVVIGEIRKGLADQKKMICITTQLIEAGVDISFPCVIRSLAGLDNAAQAAGRCNRNAEWDGICKVYLIFLREENVGMLSDIRTAQIVAKQVIRNRNYTDLLAVETMSAYFEKYYMERRKELSWRTEDAGVNTSLLNLLSTNKHRWDLRHAAKRSMHAQAFKSAGKRFKVIDQNTVSVIVPDNDEAKQLISALRSDCFEWDYVPLLRKAQKYVVEIYQETLRKLTENHAIEWLSCGVYVLDENYYDPKVGIVLEGRPMDLLVF